MADAMLSVAAERLIALIEQEVRFHFNLVRGAEKEVRSLAKELKTIRNVLDDAENRRFQDKNINSWLSRLEQTSYEMEDVLDEWNYALLKLQNGEHRPDVDGAPKKKVFSCIPSSSCLCFKKTAVRHHIATKILNVKARLDEIFKEKDRYGFVISQPTTDPLPVSWRDQSTSQINLGDVQGRDTEGEILVSKLMANGGSQRQLGVPVVSIVGVGGLGKTTLAQLVYNHSQVEKSFELRIWICVSDPFDLAAIARGILESIKKGSSQGADQLDVLFKRVSESILGKKFLLVLDDVWTEDYKKWEPLENLLRCGGAGSKILVTTRSKRVAGAIGTRDSEIFQPGLLSDDDCWLVLSRMSLAERDWAEFEGIGKKIAQKCKGLPLAAKTLGGLLRFKRSLIEWEDVLNSEIWKMREVEDEVFRPLLMSYKELSPTQKLCFSYCAFFPKDYEIDVENLIGNWMALGYLGSNNDDMEHKGKECFDALVSRSLIQVPNQKWEDHVQDKKICQMHDIVHDFAKFLRKSDWVETVEMSRTSCGACDPLLVTSVNEFRSMYCKVDSLPSICGCLVRLKVLSLSRRGLRNVPHGMDKLIHLRWLNMYGNELSMEELKIIFLLYHLQTLSLQLCSLEKIPQEIENLSDLRHLNLSSNRLEELPVEIGNLKHLRHLDLMGNAFLKELPSEIGKLTLLQSLLLPNWGTRFRPWRPCRISESLAQLTSLRMLIGFVGGSGWGNFGLLKNLNQLGVVYLFIRLDGRNYIDVVDDAREAELSSKIHIEKLFLEFELEEEEEVEEESMMNVMDALTPHPNLRTLGIVGYKGSKLPLWIVSPLNKLTKFFLVSCRKLTSLPSLGKLQCLEEIHVAGMEALEFVGREFLGTTTNTNVVAFPKLKKLKFELCPEWKEWEDITAEEDESAPVQIMPCLEKLSIEQCNALTVLPRFLLHKMSSLKTLELHYSAKLIQRYNWVGFTKWQLLSRKFLSHRHPVRVWKQLTLDQNSINRIRLHN